MNAITIRKAKSIELPLIQNLSDELAVLDLAFDKEINTKWAHGKDGETYYRNKIEEKDGVCFVAEQMGHIVGYLTGSRRTPSSWRLIKLVELDNLFVKENRRSSGIGKRLVEIFIKWAKEQNTDRIVVSAFYLNDRVVSFYKREGFLPYDINLELKVS